MDKCLIFNHIPKTAGSSMSSAVNNALSKSVAWGLVKPKSSTGFRIGFGYRIGTKRTTGKVVCAMGHWAYNHAFTSGLECSMFTMLRDPVERVISHFVELQTYRAPSQPEGFLISPKISLEEVFIKSPDIYLNPKCDRLHYRAGRNFFPWTSNLYCGYLYGSGAVSNQHWPITQEICDKVIANLRNHKVTLRNVYDEAQTVTLPHIIGITERFDDSLKLFSKRFGWNNPRYSREPSRRKSAKRGYYNISDKLRNAITEHNQFDCQVYKAAKAIFAKDAK